MKKNFAYRKASVVKNSLLTVIGLLFIPILLINCDPPEPIPEQVTGKIKLVFDHYINGVPATYDQMTYWNAAGNKWELAEVQWFISDVTLHKPNGDSVFLDAYEFNHYVDTDIPASKEWALEDKIDTGYYDHLSFTLGIKGEKNIPFMFVNPPENQMFWPYHLGGDEGGYHYLKMNGFWQDTNTFRRGFNFHLGVGQEQWSTGIRKKVYDPDWQDSSYVFIQNWFEVELDGSSFTLGENKTKQIEIIMHLEKWLSTPHAFDFNVWGADIMENQAAMKLVKENGHNVFTVGEIKDL
jgi:hypothetical protein